MLDNQTKIGLLATMLKIRKTELQFAFMFKHGKLPGGAHLYEGEEAVAAGVCASLRKNDYLFSTHRGHGHCIAKGADLKTLMAEVCGKKTGCSGGKGGTMHLFFPDFGVMGTSGIVGGGMPLATGAGLSIKVRGSDQVAVTFFGDGASNNGAFHESLNMASLWKLPVLFVCENNQYATSVNVKRSTSVKDIGVRGAAYDMPGITVDGNHVDEVYAAAAEAVARCRSGKGPSLIECKTYRVRGHFEGDDALNYRTREEVEEARGRDPIEYWKKVLSGENLLSAQDIDTMEMAVEKEVAEAAAFAEASPFPLPEDALILGNVR